MDAKSKGNEASGGSGLSGDVEFLDAEQFAPRSLLAETRIDIGIEIGVLQMNVNDLLDLTAGQAFEFEFDPRQLVSLMVGEEQIGTGRFVEEQGQVYLQIERVYRPEENNNCTQQPAALQRQSV